MLSLGILISYGLYVFNRMQLHFKLKAVKYTVYINFKKPYQSFDQYGNPSVHSNREEAKPECTFLQHPYKIVHTKTGIISKKSISSTACLFNFYWVNKFIYLYLSLQHSWRPTETRAIRWLSKTQQRSLQEIMTVDWLCSNTQKAKPVGC